MKHSVVCLFLTMATWTFPATAQNSQVGMASAKASPDPLHTATKPLTPKSAMPTHRKSTTAPNPPKSGSNTTAELIHLEQQNVKAPASKSGTAGTMKETPKATGTSASSSSGINFKYQKPAGGPQAPNSGANSKSSGTPRVTKKN
jgi:hypothetical protein